MHLHRYLDVPEKRTDQRRHSMPTIVPDYARIAVKFPIRFELYLEKRKSKCFPRCCQPIDVIEALATVHFWHQGQELPWRHHDHENAIGRSLPADRRTG